MDVPVLVDMLSLQVLQNLRSLTLEVALKLDLPYSLEVWGSLRLTKLHLSLSCQCKLPPPAVLATTSLQELSLSVAHIKANNIPRMAKKCCDSLPSLTDLRFWLVLDKNKVSQALVDRQNFEPFGETATNLETECRRVTNFKFGQKLTVVVMKQAQSGVKMAQWLFV